MGLRLVRFRAVAYPVGHQSAIVWGNGTERDTIVLVFNRSCWALFIAVGCSTNGGVPGIDSTADDSATPASGEPAQQVNPSSTQQDAAVDGGIASPAEAESVDDTSMLTPGPTGSECRGDDECNDTDTCLGTAVEVPLASGEACLAADQCPDGMTCHWINTRDQRCGPPCTSDDDCPSFNHLFECMDQRCSYRWCSDALPCPIHFECVVSAAGDITIFCARKGCSDNDACQGGLCVNHKCHDVSGVCTPR